MIPTGNGKLTRRDFLRASSALVAALTLPATELLRPKEAQALETIAGGAPVLWLQAQSCSGCSISLLNSISLSTIDGLLVGALDLESHPTLMASAGNLAVSAAEKTYRRGGYVLVVEGAIPTADGGKYCQLWPGLTALEGVARYAKRAAFIIAVGTCAAFGGLVAGAPNPTGAKGLDASYYGKTVIKLPGCPCHPDWIVGTVAHLLANGTAPSLDSLGRPTEFFQTRVHDRCPLRGSEEANMLAQPGCLSELGCKGRTTRADCPNRRWNSGGKDQVGVNWCIGSGAPCFGCTEPSFPDGMSPFYWLEEADDDD